MRNDGGSDQVGNSDGGEVVRLWMCFEGSQYNFSSSEDIKMNPKVFGLISCKDGVVIT